VPGISAANGCAAYAGIPLTERGGALSVRFITLYKSMLQDDDFWESIRRARNETFVFYMSTPHYTMLCDKLIELGFPKDYPLVAIEQGTTEFHREYPSTIGSFADDWDPATFTSPCLLIVGEVTRWVKQNQWKDAPQENGTYFDPLPDKGSVKEKDVA